MVFKTVVIGGALILVILVVASLSEKPSNSPPDAANNPPAAVSDSSTAPIVDPFQQISAAEHLAEAKKALGPDRPPDAATEMRLAEAEKHLEAIQQSDKEFTEAQKLKDKLEKRNRELERVIAITARKAFAAQLERTYLSKGFDVYVTTPGKDKSTLKLKYVLFSRPMIQQFSDGLDVAGIKALGFKTLVLTDGYDKTWTWRLD